MSWDRDSYRREVLEPARQAGNVPPADLYQRYGLPPGATDSGGVRQQIDRVIAYWQELRGDRVYGTLAGRLIVANRDLERDGPLTVGKLALLAEQARQQVREKLVRQAGAVASAATHAGPDTVANLRDIFGESVTTDEVTAALKAAGVVVVQTFPPLPATPHPQLPTLSPYLEQLGRHLSAEIIFGDDVRGGFRVLGGFQLSDGRRLDQAAMAQAQHETGARPYDDPRTAPTRSALTIMRTAAAAEGGLDALVLSEVVERLRQFVRLGITVQRSVATHAADLGLADDDAGLLAAALLSEGTGEDVRQQIEEKLSAGRLREAQRLAARLPAGDPLRRRVAEVDATLTGLDRAAAAELAQGRTEAAAERLAEAIGLARDDDDLADRLKALPPPRPRSPRVRLDGEKVLVTWEPSPARAGHVRYLVVRGMARSPVSVTDGTPVGTHTGARSVTDAQAPAGAELRYSVFADRGGEVHSPPAAAPPLVFVPDVTVLDVAERETSITVSLRAHPETESVRVVRTRGDDEETAVPTSLVGFTDHDLRTGAEYRYLINAVYRAPDGRRLASADIVVAGTPTREPDAVTDLTAEIPGTDDATASAVPLILRWTPPRHGQIRLARADHPPSWRAGTTVRAERAFSDVPGVPADSQDGRAVLRTALSFGLHYVTALTESGQLMAVGNTVEIRLVEPVHDVRATRRHDSIELSWAWPEDATDVIVRHPGGELTCSRRAYFDEGGVAVAAGRRAASFGIVAVRHGRSGLVSSPEVRVNVPARAVGAYYAIRRTGRPLRRREQRAVQITAEETVQAPPLVVVQTTGQYAPASPAEGERIHEIGGQRIQHEQPVKVTIGLAHLRPGWLACFVDPEKADPAADPILLFHPPADQMRIP